MTISLSEANDQLREQSVILAAIGSIWCMTGSNQAVGKIFKAILEIFRFRESGGSPRVPYAYLASEGSLAAGCRRRALQLEGSSTASPSIVWPSASWSRSRGPVARPRGPSASTRSRETCRKSPPDLPGGSTRACRGRRSRQNAQERVDGPVGAFMSLYASVRRSASTCTGRLRAGASVGPTRARL
jgi:hypothetical protein